MLFNSHGEYNISGVYLWMAACRIDGIITVNARVGIPIVDQSGSS